MKKIGLSLLAFLLGALFVLYVQAGIWESRFCVEDDVMQYLLPFSHGQDMVIDSDDLISRYSLIWNTSGSRWFYQFAVQFLDPLLVSKLLPVLLCGLTSLFIYLFVSYIWSVFSGFLAAGMLVVYAWNIHAFSGGCPRSFAFPLLAAFLFFIVSRKNICVLAVIFLGVLFYPQTALVMVTIAMGWVLLGWFRGRTTGMIRNFVFCGLMLLVAAGLMGWGIMHLPVNNFLGDLYSFNEMKLMPEFGKGGRCPFFVDWRYFISDVVAMERFGGIDLFSPAGFLLLVTGGIGWYLALIARIKYHAVFGLILITSLIWYVLSWPLMLHTFFPGRFFKFTIPLFLAVMGAGAIEHVTLIKDSHWRFCLRGVVILLILVFMLPGVRKDFVCYPKPELYEFIARLPAEAMIAGHPNEMNEVTVFSRKKVFLTEELSLPFYRAYYKKISQRTYDLFALYYALDWAAVKQICALNNIRYVVVRERHFTKEYFNEQFLKGEGGFYFEPFGRYVRNLVSGHGPDDFVFSRVPSIAKIYSNRGYFVVDVNLMPVQ